MTPQTPPSGLYWQAHCGGCGTLGPISASAAECLEQWATRPAPGSEALGLVAARKRGQTWTVRVKYASGSTYIASVNGLKASCTMGAQQAIEALARKAWPGKPVVMRQLSRELWVVEEVAS